MSASSIASPPRPHKALRPRSFLAISRPPYARAIFRKLPQIPDRSCNPQWVSCRNRQSCGSSATLHSPIVTKSPTFLLLRTLHKLPTTFSELFCPWFSCIVFLTLVIKIVTAKLSSNCFILLCCHEIQLIYKID